MASRPDTVRFPPPSLPSSWQGSDPLVQLLEDLHAELRGPYFFEEGHHLMLEAFVASHPCDPNALVKAPHTDAGVCSVLTYLLERTKPKAHPAHIPWPKDLAGFEGLSLPQGQEPHPGERLAAKLLAAGANPWAKGTAVRDKPPQKGVRKAWGYPTVNAPIFHALRLGWTGLAERMLELPGAPSIEKIAHDPTEWMNLPVRESASVNESWMHRAAAGESLLPVLKWFLDNGVRPNPASQYHVLEQACPQAVEVFRERGLLPTDAPTRRRLTSAWRARTKSGEIAPGVMAKMASALEGKQASRQDVVAADLMALLTQTPWGSGVKSRQDILHYGRNTGTQELVERARVSSGMMAGNWSRLAALLVDRMRQTERGSWSIRGVDFDGMLDKEDAGTNAPLLASAIGFDWNPGMPIDGFVSFALMASSWTDGSGAEKIARAATLLGVEDPYAWAKEHAPTAIAFTSRFMKTGSPFALESMCAAWFQVLRAFPGILDDDPKIKRDLLAALTGDFAVPAGTATQRAAYIVSPRDPTLPGSFPKDLFTTPGPEQGAEVSLVLEVALATRKKEWLEGICEQFEHLSDQDVDRIVYWLETLQKSKKHAPLEGMGALESKVRERKLQADLPKVQVPSPRPGMGRRF